MENCKELYRTHILNNCNTPLIGGIAIFVLGGINETDKRID